MHRRNQVLAGVAPRAQQPDGRVEPGDVLLMRFKPLSVLTSASNSRSARRSGSLFFFPAWPTSATVTTSCPWKVFFRASVHVLVLEYTQLKLFDSSPAYRLPWAGRLLPSPSKVVSR